MKRLILIAALFAASGCAILSEEEIAGCEGDELCISNLIEQKEYEREDRAIQRYDKALARYLILEQKCAGHGGVAIRCDQISKVCGRHNGRKKIERYSVWELESAGCGANVFRQLQMGY